MTREDAVPTRWRTRLQVRARLDEIAACNRLPTPDLILVPGWIAATHYRPTHGTIVLGRRTARRLSDSALDGVLAHECAHLYFDDGAAALAHGRARALARDVAPLAAGMAIVFGTASLWLYVSAAVHDPFVLGGLPMLGLMLGTWLGFWRRDRTASRGEGRRHQWRRELRADFQACRAVGTPAVAAGIDERILQRERTWWRRRTESVPPSVDQPMRALIGGDTHPPPGQRLQALRGYDPSADPDGAALDWLSANGIYPTG